MCCPLVGPTVGAPPAPTCASTLPPGPDVPVPTARSSTKTASPAGQTVQRLPSTAATGSVYPTASIEHWHILAFKVLLKNSLLLFLPADACGSWIGFELLVLFLGLKCDGSNDCVDGSDEADCQAPATCDSTSKR